MFEDFILTNDMEYNACPVKGQVIFSKETNQLFCNKIPDEYKDALIAYCNNHIVDFEPEIATYLINPEQTMAIMIASINLSFTDFIGNLTHEDFDPQI